VSWSEIPIAPTREQVAGRKEKAERFIRNVLGDEERADEISDEDLDDYAARRHFEIINPANRRTAEMPSKKELEDRIAELEEENADLNDRLASIGDLVGTDEDDEEEDDDSGN
jgi:uncharacterized protein YceH (UPF0502 family)